MRKSKSLTALLLSSALLVSAISAYPSTNVSGAVVVENPESTASPMPTKTPAPTKTPVPTKTPKPTKTPAATKTPKPTKTPTATKTPRPDKSKATVKGKAPSLSIKFQKKTNYGAYNRIRVKFKLPKGATGYEYRYKVNKGPQKNKWRTRVMYTLTKNFHPELYVIVTQKGTYSFQIRSYNQNNNTYSKWSKTKKVKVKKIYKQKAKKTPGMNYDEG